MKINSVEELDEVMNQDFKTDTQRWARVIGFYNRVRRNGCQSLIDFLETATSLVKSLKRQGYQPTPYLLAELIELYVRKEEMERLRGDLDE